MAKTMKNVDGTVVCALQYSMLLEQLCFDERGGRKIYCSFSILCKLLYTFLPKIAYNNLRIFYTTALGLLPHDKLMFKPYKIS
jgi:hypothetical protein